MSNVQKFYSIWKDSKAGQAFPCKSKFRPMLLGRDLSFTYVLEEGKDGIHYRLAGSSMEHLWRQTLSNEPLSLMMKSMGQFNLYYGLMRYALKHKLGLRLHGLVKDSDKSFIDFEELVLPFKRKEKEEYELIGLQSIKSLPIILGDSYRPQYVLTGVTVIPTAANYNAESFPQELSDMLYASGLDLKVCQEKVA